MPVYDRSEERAMLKRAQRGDDQSFAGIVEAYQRPVFNLCYRMLGDAREAEDAAQEAFLKAYHALDRYDPGRKFVNWILSIASNHCVDRLRKRRLRLISLGELLPGTVRSDPAESPEPVLEQRERREAIQELLAALSPTDRAAVALRYWYDMSYLEIAEALDLTVSAVKSRLHRSRRKLAEGWLAREQSSAVRMEEAR